MDGVVAVGGDGAQVEDGRRAREDVERQPHVAEDLAEHPVATHVVHDVERHHQDGDHEVSDGQRDDEVVGHTAQWLVREHRHDDESVADYCATYTGSHETGGYDRLYL